MRRRFFVDRFDSQSASLLGETADHLGRVLRAAPGQLYELSDGQHVWLGRIERVVTAKRGESRIDFSLVQPIEQRLDPLVVQLYLSVVKFDRFEWCLEKATELGVSTIVPLASARSDKALIAAAEKRRERWQRILVESAQQARRLQAPVLGAIAGSEAAFAACDAARGILLSELPGAPPLRDILTSATSAESIAFAVGPEGGWTEDEIAIARKAQFVEASLSNHILRTETAVIAALAIIRLGFGGRADP